MQFNLRTLVIYTDAKILQKYLTEWLKEVEVHLKNPMITFIAGSRPCASGPQTLAANSDVELDQPECKWTNLSSTASKRGYRKHL